MNSQLNQATRFIEGQILMAEEAADEQRKQISELAKEVVRQDMTLSFGELESIDIEEVVAKAIEMSADGDLQFYIENQAAFVRAECELDEFKKHEMKLLHWNDLQAAAEVLIASRYEAIMQTINEQAA